MNCLHLITAMLIFQFSSAQASSMADPHCIESLKQKTSLEENYAAIIHYLHTPEIGLSSLTSMLDNGEVKVILRPWRPWILQVTGNVSPVLAQKSLLLPRLDLSTEEKRQRAIWDVAMALYTIQITDGLWTKAATLPEHRSSDRQLHRLSRARIALHDLAQRWQAEKVERFARLQGEMYRLLESLTLLDEKVLLPNHDGTPLWIFFQVAFRDPSRTIGPNLEDYSHWRSGGDAALIESVERQHGRSLLADYYFNWIKRVAVVATVGYFLIDIAPALPEYVRGRMEYNAVVNELQQAPSDAEQLIQELSSLRHHLGANP